MNLGVGESCFSRPGYISTCGFTVFGDLQTDEVSLCLYVWNIQMRLALFQLLFLKICYVHMLDK